ncbi:hypothetical protein OG788_27880 [Streptomyces sp. NBC_00647]|uniref:hypothetical protein n=1 Tax=Streptomyces sp. NBC_00647 TaxID=2975796 RepID=UPI00324ACCF3
MLGGLAQAGTKALGGDRFSLLSVLPGAIVVTTVSVLVGAHAYDPGREMDLGDALPADHKLVTLGFAAVGIFLGGVLLRPFEMALIQLLEGYWPEGSLRGRVRPLAVERHRRLRDRAAALEETRAVLPPEPSSLTQLARFHRALAREGRIVERARRRGAKYSRDNSELMPTALGNTLKSMEERTGRRHGIDVLSAYRRIYPSVAPEFRQAVEEQLDLISVTSSLCLAFGAVSLAASPLILRLSWWTLVVPAAMMASALAYRGAQKAAQDHEELLKAVFDVHRFDLAAALHYELRTTAAEERELNSRITAFLIGNEPLADHDSLKDEPLTHPENTPPRPTPP